MPPPPPHCPPQAHEFSHTIIHGKPKPGALVVEALLPSTNFPTPAAAPPAHLANGAAGTCYSLLLPATACFCHAKRRNPKLLMRGTLGQAAHLPAEHALLGRAQWPLMAHT